MTRALAMLLTLLSTPAMASPITAYWTGPARPPVAVPFATSGIDYTTANFDWQGTYGGLPGEYSLYAGHSPLVAFLGADTPPGYAANDMGQRRGRGSAFTFLGTLDLSLGSTITISHTWGDVYFALQDALLVSPLPPDPLNTPLDVLGGTDTITITQALVDSWPSLIGPAVPFYLQYDTESFAIVDNPMHQINGGRTVYADIASLSMNAPFTVDPPADPPQGVPEPATLLLLVPGLLLIIRRLKT